MFSCWYTSPVVGISSPVQNVDKRTLSCAIGSNDSDSGAKRALERNILDLRLRCAWILERHTVDADDCFGLRLHAFKEARLWELELHFGSAKLVVRFRRWHSLDEFIEVTTVTLKLEALEVEHVLNNLVEELLVVRNDDRCAR